jgi:hypothetical protein
VETAALALAGLQAGSRSLECRQPGRRHPETLIVAGELGVLVGASCSRLGDLTRGLAALEPALPRCRAQFGDRHPITLHCRTLHLEAFNGVSQYELARNMAPAPLAGLLVSALQVSSSLTNNLMQARLAEARATGQPLLQITPVLQRRVGLFDTAAMPALVNAGRRATEAALPDIVALLRRAVPLAAA